MSDSMKSSRIAVLAVVLLALTIVPFAADDADAVAVINNGDGQVSWDFDSMDGGYIKFSVNNLDGSFTMDVTVYEGDRAVATLEGVRVAANSVTEVTVDMPDFKSVGSHLLRVECTPAGQFDGSHSFNLSVEVSKNLLSNWATYAVIAVVVIVIAIFAYLKIRDTPKNKPEMTFEELEEQRKAEMAERAEKKQKKEKPAAKTTERRRYTGGEKKAESSEPVKAKEEKPKMTFEELEAQKKAQKAEKKSTGLTERERYLAEKRKKNKEE